MNDNKNNLRNKCRAALRQGPGKMERRTITKPELEEGKVLVRIQHIGICGSDIARVKDNDPKWDNIVMGHEAVGYIEEISNNALKESSFKKGDNVAIIPLIPCQNCYFCKKGLYSSCSNYSFIGSRINGALCEYLVADPGNLIKIPEDKNLEKYSLLEPITVALHAIYKTDIKFGKTAVIFGAGAIGLLLFQILKNIAQYEIIMVDVDDFKLNLAKELGSSHNVNSTKESLEEYIKKNISGNGIDAVFEVSGANEAKTSAVNILKPSGKIVFIGTSARDTIFNSQNFELILRKECNIEGAWMSYSSPFPGIEWEAGLKILKNDLIDVDTIITHRYKLDDISAAFNMILSGDQKYCKVIIKI